MRNAECVNAECGMRECVNPILNTLKQENLQSASPIVAFAHSRIPAFAHWRIRAFAHSAFRIRANLRYQ